MTLREAAEILEVLPGGVARMVMGGRLGPKHEHRGRARGDVERLALPGPVGVWHET